MAEQQAPIRRPTPEQLARAVRADCDAAIRLLDVLIRERNDVLLLRARDAVARAAAVSRAQLRGAAHASR
jgi:hypothetical protein